MAAESDPPPNTLARALDGCRGAWTLLRHQGPGQVQFWFIALVIGVAAGFAALGFRLGVYHLQALLYGTDDPDYLGSFAASLPWWWVVALPACGGLAVGLILHRFTPDGRVRSVADVIEGAALREGRVEKRAGIASALASMITLSSGGSSGREGPVVHLAAVIASWGNNLIRADGVTGRDLLGCAVAAAVSASFNAPIAGALFALEVVLRHFAIHAFAPIAIAAVAGTVVTRTTWGDATEFDPVVENGLAFYVELPAFLLLGLICGAVGVLLIRAVFWCDDAGNALTRRGLPRWARPMLAGLVVGAIAVPFPHVIGVGYETTERALAGELILWEAVVFAAMKVAACAVTLGGRMGGGIFSPALVTGALTGLAFGIVATAAFPQVSSATSLYALAGMGAVAAAVLGAPISTTMIVFELTGDWQTGIAVMASVSVATALSSRLVHRSFFLSQLERRDLHVAAGPQAYLLRLVRVRDAMRLPGHPRAAPAAALDELVAEGLSIASHATLEEAMPLFERAGPFVPVVEGAAEGRRVTGALFQLDALKAYNRLLAARAAEEHS